MLRKIALFLVVVSALVARPEACFAWGKSGHRIVMIIAWKYMNDAAKAQISQVLNGNSGSTLVPADVANWADDIRSNKAYDAIKNLHFMNIPLTINTLGDVPSAQINPSGDVITAVEALSVFLQKGDPTALDSVKAFSDLQASGIKIDQQMAAKLLFHFLGDIAQPLHFGAAEDMGGNQQPVQLTFQRTNLHSAWDSLLNGEEKYSSDEYSDFLEHSLTTMNQKAWTEADLITVANETIAVRKKLYEFPDGYVQNANAPQPPAKQIPVLGYGYESAVVPIMNETLLRGGVFAASFLNKVFSPTAQTSPPMFDLRHPLGTKNSCEAVVH